jgi:glycosyltransferase involved in cell wall biosynthesis
MKRPKVLIFVATYWPGFKSGGPIRSIRNFVTIFSDQYDIFVVTEDRDKGDPHPYPQVKFNEWNTVDGARVIYLTKGMITPLRLVKICEEVNPDLIYLNSFFNPRFTILPLMLSKVGVLIKTPKILLAPRGEFSPAALSLKYFKKLVYILFYKACLNDICIHWQFSSEEERRDCSVHFKLCDSSFSISLNLTAKPNTTSDRSRIKWGNSHVPKFVFLGRIVPMKNLDYLLGQLRYVQSPIELHIYGPREDVVYARKCEVIASELSSRVKIQWHGMVDNEIVPDVLSQYDFLVCPSRGENFGHVIYEALSVGLPVIVSDKTPWKSLEHKGIGWVRPLDDKGKFLNAIEKAISLSYSKHYVMSRQASMYANELHVSTGIRDSHLKAIEAAIRGC